MSSLSLAVELCLNGELMHGAQAGTGAGKYGKVGSIPSILGFG